MDDKTTKAGISAIDLWVGRLRAAFRSSAELNELKMPDYDFAHFSNDLMEGFGKRDVPLEALEAMKAECVVIARNERRREEQRLISIVNRALEGAIKAKSALVGVPVRSVDSAYTR